MEPFFSIVVACCDVAPYVRECLDSVSKQSFADWECVVGVEASKDATERLVREYAEKDGRFRVFTGPRTGSCSASRNTGVELARGAYVLFLDGDDTIAEGCLGRLHDKIAARPGADIYPCAMRVLNEVTGAEEPLRDNYAPGFGGELTGPEAVLASFSRPEPPCPMLQLSAFRREFLVARELRCIVGLRRQDSEFSPRALYLARRVVPLHEPFYNYRIRPGAVGSGARGAGHFHRDWAVILRSLLAFHAKVSREAGFDARVARCWARQWLSWLFYFWFSPENVRAIPRGARAETLETLFGGGFGDLRLLARSAPPVRRLACAWVRAFVRHAAARGAAEKLFALYFRLAERRAGGKSRQ